MLTDTLQNLDNPWRRLRWTLPMSLVIWTLALWSLAYFMTKPTHRQAEQPPIDAQFLELPAPEPIVKPEPPKVLPKPTPKPKPLEKQAVKTQETISAPTEPQALPATEAPPVANAPSAPAAPSVPLEPSPTSRDDTASNAIMNSGARAIARPMPQIPDDLREETFNAVALARFHIAADGKATVELAKPTRNPRLNRILLDTLKDWKFSPAIKDGKPVASTQDIIIKIDVD